MTSKNFFNEEKLTDNLQKVFSALTAFEHLMNDEIAQGIATESYVEKVLDDFEGDLDSQVELEIVGEHFQNLEHAKYILRRQMIVLTVTYIEIALDDFFFTLFATRPKLLLDFYNKDKSNTSSETRETLIKQIVSADSINSVIESLARNVSDTLSKPKPKFAEKISKWSGQSIDSDTIKQLESLFVLRNEIVHESSEPRLTHQKVMKYIVIALEFIDELDTILKAKHG